MLSVSQTESSAQVTRAQERPVTGTAIDGLASDVRGWTARAERRTLRPVYKTRLEPDEY